MEHYKSFKEKQVRAPFYHFTPSPPLDKMSFFLRRLSREITEIEKTLSCLEEYLQTREEKGGEEYLQTREEITED